MALLMDEGFILFGALAGLVYSGTGLQGCSLVTCSSHGSIEMMLLGTAVEWCIFSGLPNGVSMMMLSHGTRFCARPGLLYSSSVIAPFCRLLDGVTVGIELFGGVS